MWMKNWVRKEGAAARNAGLVLTQKGRDSAGRRTPTRLADGQNDSYDEYGMALKQRRTLTPAKTDETTTKLAIRNAHHADLATILVFHHQDSANAP